ncbi:caspase domain-containing protein [Candidatus Eisenbacteria bacterium]|uniref:Caspase domain-containing protein n=1 Tax=Eiseniibacteriota bacterium TaxID=2212470 RepID=A0ABV6YJ12_UNCEI
MSSRIRILIIITLILFPSVVTAAGPARRFVLAAGANSGGPERVPLRYAVSDAELFVNVLMEMGGVELSDHLLLAEPNLKELAAALRKMRDQVSSSSDDVGRTEILFYYSGHADEAGLLLGEERLSYQELRRMMDTVPADVRITVLDACASGAITRIKGGQRRQAFLVDDSSDMTGYAFLTSSSADEVAQESDQIGSSFFTHYLLSGMRGAADVSSDGKVSLTEAYEFAFHETLASTTETRGGAQHPAYEFNLTGTGDVVMTDLRETSAGLLLTEELSGRFFVRNADRQLVAELFKPKGRAVELGLEPGKYTVYLAQEEELLLGSSMLRTGDRVVLRPADFQSVEREPATVRGTRPGAGPVAHQGLGNAGGLSVARRHRFELLMGYGDSGETQSLQFPCSSQLTTKVEDVLGAFSYAYWVREELAVHVTFSGLVVQARESVGSLGTCNTAVVVSSALFGIRYYPFATPYSHLRPYVAAAVGPYIGVESTSEMVGFTNESKTRTLGSFGGRLGGGLDIQLSRLFMVGFGAGYNFMDDFRESLGGKKNFGAADFSIGFSILIG